MTTQSQAVLWRTCDAMAESKSSVYGSMIIEMCRKFMGRYRKEIINVFDTKFEVSDGVDHFFTLKHRLCDQTVQRGCMGRPLTGNEMNPCVACSRLMTDIQRVASWGVGLNNFGTREHLYKALDDICLTIPIRYPLDRRDILFETCAELMDEHTASIVAVLSKTLLNAKNPSKAGNEAFDPIQEICTKKTGSMNMPPPSLPCI